MPRTFLTNEDRLLDLECRKLHANLLAAGIKNPQVAEWLGCSVQNVSYLWRNKSFSFKQYLILQDKLERMQK